jgi:ABC-type multidrug transport system fused ATPase/permease subunit
MVRLLAAYQAKPYEFHLYRNSTDLINTVLWYTAAFTGGVLAPLLRLTADGLVVVALGVFLAVSDARAVLLLAMLIALVFMGVTRAVRTRLSHAAEQTARLNSEVMQSVGQALGALREVRILGREPYFRERLSVAAHRMVESVAVQSVLQLVPRQVIEVAMVAFLVALVWLAQATQRAADLVPLLGMFAAAAVRLMPASTALLSNWNNMRANRFALRTIAEELAGTNVADAVDAPSRVSGHHERGEAFRELVLDGVSMRYRNGTEPVLRGVSLSVAAGEVVAIVGRSGAGKSTLADVVLGLLVPEAGSIRVNGWDIHAHLSRWHRMVAYIPQTVYLLDDTLRRNIALGVADAEIHPGRLGSAVAGAQLVELLQQLPEGLETVVGERGVRLSGGQRQRVAIARALYHQREFLILDEATSALDEETERAVVASVAGLTGRMTVMVIAHRESTLGYGERRIVVEGGRVFEARVAPLTEASE